MEGTIARVNVEQRIRIAGLIRAGDSVKGGTDKQYIYDLVGGRVVWRQSSAKAVTGLGMAPQDFISQIEIRDDRDVVAFSALAHQMPELPSRTCVFLLLSKTDNIRPGVKFVGMRVTQTGPNSVVLSLLNDSLSAPVKLNLVTDLGE